MAEQGNRLVLKLSPNVRLRLTFEREMQLDADGSIFNDALHQRYLDMHSRAIAKQESVLKATIVTDGLLALLLFGKNVTIPGTTIGIQDLPAAAEVLTTVASFSFMALGLAFFNAQAYEAICQQFTKRLAKKRGIDPDFISSAYTPTELYVKLFRGKMNVFGSDFFEPGRGYRIFYPTLLFMLVLAFLSIALLHFSIVGYSLWKSFALNWISLLFCGSVVLMNVAGLLVNATWQFAFTVPPQSPPPTG